MPQHPFFDWLNVYGIRLLEPFSSQWFYGDTLFIIDPWLWAMLIGSVWWSRRREKAGGDWARPARVGVVAVLAYIGVNGVISHQAVQDVRTAHSDGHHSPPVIASPVPLAFWERETIRTGLMGGQGPDEIAPVYWMGRWTPLHGLDDEAMIPERPCNLFDWKTAGGSQVDAFLFWSRAPFAVRADDGSVILYDSRYYDPRARDRFSVALPDAVCEPLSQPSP